MPPNAKEFIYTNESMYCLERQLTNIPKPVFIRSRVVRHKYTLHGKLVNYTLVNARSMFSKVFSKLSLLLDSQTRVDSYDACSC